MQDIPADTKRRWPSSRVLEEVIRQAPSEYVTVGWLTSTLHRDSFGIVMVCLGLLATTPIGLRLGGLAMHLLKYLEKVVHPRWPRVFEAARCAVGVMVLLLTLVLLLTPVPLSNVAPAMVISLISLAYVEEDGLLLSVGFLAATILIGLGSATIGEQSSARPSSAASSNRS